MVTKNRFQGARFGAPMKLDKSIKLTTVYIKMKIDKDITVAGRTIDVYIHPHAGSHVHGRTRRHMITADRVRKNNDRMARKYLTELINANFGKGSALFTLTYKELPDPERAKRELQNFIRRMKRRIPKLKAVYVTEYENHRPHHHIVMNTVDAELVKDAWGDRGYVKESVLDDTGEYSKLADYLIKETAKTFRMVKGLDAQRYGCTRNLTKPVTVRTQSNVQELEDEPEPIKGYYIVKDSVRRYEHPVTGLMCLEYTMAALGEPRKYKRWPRGVRASKERFIVEEWNEQDDLFDIF